MLILLLTQCFGRNIVLREKFTYVKNKKDLNNLQEDRNALGQHYNVKYLKHIYVYSKGFLTFDVKLK